ncbi:MAG: AI-2E family transporter [Chloroflexota bacterium]
MIGSGALGHDGARDLTGTIGAVVHLTNREKTVADQPPSGRLPAVRTLRFELAPRTMVSVVVTIGAIWLLSRVWQIVLMLAIALVLAGSLSPVVVWLEHHRIPRPLALTLILLGMVVSILGLAVLVAPALASEVGSFVTSAPATQVRIADVLQQVPALASEAAAIRSVTPDAVLGPLGKHALGIIRAAAEIVGLGLATAVLAFYILADRERVQGFAFSLLPRRFHLRTAHVLLDMETVVGGYVRGQAITSLLIGVFVFVLLIVVGTPNALALAVFAALTDLVPFIGGVLALLPAVLATLPFGAGRALVVLVAIVLYQQLESNLIVPRIYGKSLRLSAVAVTLALLVGGTLLGILGALLALPIAAGIRVLIEDLRIDLPGEQTGERAQRAEEDEAEATYEAAMAGVPVVEAAATATAMVEEMQDHNTGVAE